MTALSADRKDIKEYKGDFFNSPVKASQTIYIGALVCEDADGDLQPGATSTALRAVGVSWEYVDNSLGSDGDETCEYKKGIFPFFNSSGADEIDESHKEEVCFIVDDQTVAATDGSSTRSVAGKVKGMDGDLVMVEVGYITSIDGDLLIANNLSDVADDATSRANIGANEVALTFPERASLDDASHTLRIVAPVAGDITKLWSVIDGALTGGDPTLTFSIDGTPITSGVITIANSGSAAGDVDSATPSAANTVAKGDVIECAVAANSQSNDQYADISLLIET